MKPLVLTLAALAVASSLAACSKKEAAAPEVAAAPAASPPTQEAPASDMAAMVTSADANMAKGSGTVTAVSAERITVDHAPIPEANWPAMTMAFKAAPELAKSVKPGDKVAFDLKLQGAAGEITAIQKQ